VCIAYPLLKNEQQLVEVITHELIHCIQRRDRRYEPGDKQACAKCLCDEMQAYYMSGMCFPGGTQYSEYQSDTIEDPERQCATAHAIRSCIAAGYCSEKPDEASLRTIWGRCGGIRTPGRLRVDSPNLEEK
jgi:hypothetical protein